MTPRRLPTDSQYVLHESLVRHESMSPTSISSETEPEQREEQVEVVRRMRIFLRERILLNPRAPGYRTPKAVAARLVVLQLLLEPTTSHTLAAYARALRCSRNYLSMIAREFGAITGLRVLRDVDRPHLRNGETTTNGKSKNGKASDRTFGAGLKKSFSNIAERR